MASPSAKISFALIASLTVSAQDPTPAVQFAAIHYFVDHWYSKDHLFFLAIDNPVYQGQDNIPAFLEPPSAFLETVHKECPRVFALSDADSHPSQGQARIHMKGTYREGIFLYLGSSRRISSKKYSLLISFYAGSHFGGGEYYDVEIIGNKWLVTKTRNAFIS